MVDLSIQLIEIKRKIVAFDFLFLWTVAPDLSISVKIIWAFPFMKQNGDLYLYACVNALTGFIALCLGISKLDLDLCDIAGYFAVLGGGCLISFGWFIVSAAIFRTYGANPWWSSRRLFKLSQHETKLA